MIIGHFSSILFPEFSRALLPTAIVGLAINSFILRFGFRKMLREMAINRAEHVVAKLDRGLFVLVCVVFVSIFAGFLAGLNLAWTAIAGAALVMVLARRDTHDVLKLVDWHLLLFFAALFIVVDGLSDTGLPDAIYSQLQPIFGSSAPGASVEPGLVFRARIKRFLQRPVCAGGRKLDHAVYGARFDVEGACACDDVCRQSHDHRFCGEHDCGGISARSYPGRFLGLRALWNSDYDSDDRCRRGRAACFALRRACAARR